MPASSPHRRLLNVLSLIVGIAGIVMVVAGITTWFLVQSQLAAEHIVVSEDASMLAGDEVNGPFSAYAQAEVINKHALAAGEGKTYAELAQDDPARSTVMTASFLRASLFTSVLAFGVAAMATGLGVLTILIGLALRAAMASVSAEPEPAVEIAPEDD